jgi:OOP family OmpA-OmpF porin
MKLAIVVLALFAVATPAAAEGKPKAPVVRVVKDQLVVPGVAFHTGKATLMDASLGSLDALAAELAKQKTLTIEIGVHTDARGADEWNLKISQERADAIRDYLISRGVAGKRLLAKGYGETKPLDKHSNAAAFATNRRIEFVIVGRVI